MSHGFKPGDRAVVVKTKSRHQYLGAVVTILSELQLLTGPRFLPGAHGYEVDVPTDSEEFGGTCVTPDQLEPYRDDGSERGEWTEELRRWCRVKEVA